MGSPASLRLIELGPGRGTLMADVLRAANIMPEFRAALAIHLVETSPRLIARQRETLPGLDVPLAWHRDVAEVPEGPAIVIANEFFDALPVHQAVKAADGWHLRMVGLVARPARLHGIARRDARLRARAARNAARCARRHGVRMARRPDHRRSLRGASCAMAAPRSSSTTARQKAQPARRCRPCAATASPTRSPSPA